MVEIPRHSKWMADHSCYDRRGDSRCFLPLLGSAGETAVLTELIVLSTGQKLSRTRQVEADPAPGFSNKVNVTLFFLRPRDLVSMEKC